MNPEQIEIARNAMALPGWEWRPGMLVRSTAITDGGYEFNARVIDNSRAPDSLVSNPLNVHGGRFYEDFECGPSNIDQFEKGSPDADYSNPEYDVGEECGKPERFVVHLADPTEATAGSLVGLLGDADIVIRTGKDVIWGQYFDPKLGNWASVMDAKTRSELYCRIAIALGRWPGGAL